MITGKLFTIGNGSPKPPLGVKLKLDNAADVEEEEDEAIYELCLFSTTLNELLSAAAK